MLRSVYQLVQAAKNGSKHKRIGNHYMENHGTSWRFYYHGNCVCFVDKVKNIVEYDDCGYTGYSSTTRTLHSYQEMFNKNIPPWVNDIDLTIPNELRYVRF